MRKIAENAGKDGSVVLETVRRTQKEQGNLHIGYDVIKEEYLDMVAVRRDRSCQGNPRRPRKCCFDRSHDPDHRSPDHGCA